MERAILVPPAGNAPAALYFTMHNRSSSDDTLVAIAVDGAERTAIHSQLHHQVGLATTAQMLPVASVPIAAGATVRFAPGGLHGQVEGFGHPLVRGDSVRITLRLARGLVSIAAEVLPYEDLEAALEPPTRRAIIAAALTRFIVAAGCASCDRAVAPSVPHGRTVYLANGCATCHGASGRGDGPISKTLSPPPRDFRDAAAFRNGIDPASIAQTIAEGIVAGGAMPRFAHLTNMERQSLALYVISLRSQPQADNSPP